MGGMVMGVYTLTYGASNLVDVVSERYDLGAGTQNTMKLCGATGAYTTSSIIKDVAFAKMFSKASTAATEMKRAVPLTTYGTFLFRDSLIIGAGFILPAMVAGAIKSNTELDAQTADKIAQLATPCAMQVVITPIHLLGLNLYNSPSATTAERFRSVASTYPEATGVRMLRFLWAYGVGGLVIGQSTATQWQCLLSGKSRSLMGRHQLMALGYANCKAPCRRQKHQRSCDTNVGLWGAEFALDSKITILLHCRLARSRYYCFS